LHEKTGQRALSGEASTKRFSNMAGSTVKLWHGRNKNLLSIFYVYVEVNGNSAKSNRGRPEIDRPELRHTLRESLPENTVVWCLTLHFANKPSQTGFDLESTSRAVVDQAILLRDHASNA
jgi:hypothetical protein